MKTEKKEIEKNGAYYLGEICLYFTITILILLVIATICTHFSK